MRNIAIILLVLLAGLFECNAQKTEFTLDYSVSYLLPSSHDTIQLSIGAKGKYLYTDSEKITKRFKKSFSRFMPGLESDPKMKLLFDMGTLDMLMYVDISGQIIAAKINLSNFFEENNSDVDTNALLSETTEEEVKVLGKKYSLLAIFPDSAPDDKLYVAFDENYELQYNTYFKELFRGILGNYIDIEIPSGIPVFAKDEKGNEVLQLLEIQKERKKGVINLSFNIE